MGRTGQVTQQDQCAAADNDADKPVIAAKQKGGVLIQAEQTVLDVFNRLHINRIFDNSIINYIIFTRSAKSNT